ncbi:MAG TPA: DUF2637 domain-containing protein [Streptosporangiaceae bacterium]
MSAGAEYVRRRVRVGAVLVVAVVAAVASYVHIFALVLAHGQPWELCALEPLSVDGLVLAASMSLAEGGWWARGMLWGAVVMTLAANVLYGWPHGFVGAVAAGWPAVAFIGSAELLIRSGGATAAAPAARGGRLAGQPARRGSGGRAAGKPAARPGRTRQRTPADVAAILQGDPKITAPVLAAKLRVKERTAARYLTEHRRAVRAESDAA